MAKERPYDDLWYSSPVQVFEKARDAASDAVDVATILIQLAQQYRDKDPNTTLSAICRNHKTVVVEDYSDLLSNAIRRFQSLLDNTPIKRFLALEQYDKPISLETLQPDAKGRCTASSYHDLAIAVACQLSESIVTDLSVADYLANLRYVTAAGDWIPDHVAKIKSFVAWESGAAIRAWQKDSEKPKQSTEPLAEGEPLTGAERDNAFRGLEPAARKAYLSFQYAESNKGCGLEDNEAHKLLTEEGISTDKGNLGELIDYPLPNFATWRRYLSEARKALREQKNKRRGGRRTGKSIVKTDRLSRKSDRIEKDKQKNDADN
jgi:hypothetical protein